jgi:hypothetical protein
MYIVERLWLNGIVKINRQQKDPMHGCRIFLGAVHQNGEKYELRNSGIWLSLQNESVLNESLSMNGHLLLNLTKRNQTHTEKVTPNLHRGALQRRNF